GPAAGGESGSQHGRGLAANDGVKLPGRDAKWPDLHTRGRIVPAALRLDHGREGREVEGAGRTALRPGPEDPTRDAGVADADDADVVEAGEHRAEPLGREAEVVVRIAVDAEEHHARDHADPAVGGGTRQLATGQRRVLAVLERVEAQRR